MSHLHQHQCVGQAFHLGHVVGDVEHRDGKALMQPFQEGQDLVPALAVERGERLVHQQQLRVGQQRAPDRHALALAAGQVARGPIEQRSEAEQRDRVVKPDAPASGLRPSPTGAP